ncbi:hypothetical protein BD626DRAFT_414888, partial [Schizophyllum amplum]
LPIELIDLVVAHSDNITLRTLAETSVYFKHIAYAMLYEEFTIHSDDDINFIRAHVAVQGAVRILNITHRNAPIELPRLPFVVSLNWTCENADAVDQVNSVEISMVLSQIPALRRAKLRLDVDVLTELQEGISTHAHVLESLEIGFPSYAPRFQQCGAIAGFSRLRRLRFCNDKKHDIGAYVEAFVAPISTALTYVCFPPFCSWTSFSNALDCLRSTIEEIELDRFVGLDPYDTYQRLEMPSLKTIIFNIQDIHLSSNALWTLIKDFLAAFQAGRRTSNLRTIRIRTHASAILDAFQAGQTSWRIFEGQHGGGQSPMEWDEWLPNIARNLRMELEIQSLYDPDSWESHVLADAIYSAAQSLGTHRFSARVIHNYLL